MSGKNVSENLCSDDQNSLNYQISTSGVKPLVKFQRGQEVDIFLENNGKGALRLQHPFNVSWGVARPHPYTNMHLHGAALPIRHFCVFVLSAWAHTHDQNTVRITSLGDLDVGRLPCCWLGHRAPCIFSHCTHQVVDMRASGGEGASCQDP